MRPTQEHYRHVYRIRRFEETVLENFSKGVFRGTTHTYLGQEANAVGVLSQLNPGDIVFSNHRCHGHYLAYGGDLRALFAEMMGKATGVCGGRGGSQHLQFKDFYSNGVQGGILPVATGMALAEKRKGSGALAVCFLGDGTLGEGLVYETLNMASLWAAPVLFVVENNRIAQTTPVELALCGQIPPRFTAFGIPACELDTSDVMEIEAAAGALLAAIRVSGGPQALILHTQRFGPHSKGDDTRHPADVAALKTRRDPLALLAARLDPSERADIEARVETEIQAAFQAALADPEPEFHPDEPPGPVDPPPGPGPSPSTTKMTVLGALNAALHRVMGADPRVVLMGEDILDPYGGAFKVTQGLSTAFPERVIATPISEAGMVGIAAGMALRGLHPVVEI
ncbi:MAG: thiamine pyrophosphate-dependent enzyme, partial [Anaerolineales bacterium]|nr:thiamine pyrophosphate-dependent enzyme [Anaerolineales bacterium]